jgi:hypothetical protein
MTARAGIATNGSAPGRVVHFWCPGCEDVHGVMVEAPNGWGWNGDLELPTFTPSVKVGGIQWTTDSGFYKLNHSSVNAGAEICCHSFVTDGRIRFLTDSTHQLAGQTVDLPPWPYS